MLILKTLTLEPMHGFGIARRIEQITRGVFKVNPGSLLTALQRLERSGWLDAEWSATLVKEQVRSYGWENAIAATLSDLRYAARRLRGKPGFTAGTPASRREGESEFAGGGRQNAGIRVRPVSGTHLPHADAARDRR